MGGHLVLERLTRNANAVSSVGAFIRILSPDLRRRFGPRQHLSQLQIPFNKSIRRKYPLKLPLILLDVHGCKQRLNLSRDGIGPKPLPRAQQ
jgi:hypothetical protein